MIIKKLCTFRKIQSHLHVKVELNRQSILAWSEKTYDIPHACCNDYCYLAKAKTTNYLCQFVLLRTRSNPITMDQSLRPLLQAWVWVQMAKTYTYHLKTCYQWCPQMISNLTVCLDKIKLTLEFSIECFVSCQVGTSLH